MDSIKNIFSIKKKRSPLMRGIEAAQVIDFLQKMMIEKWGAAVLEQVRVLHLKNQVITIASLNSVVANEIKFQERDFINKINTKFAPGTVLKFKYMI